MNSAEAALARGAAALDPLVPVADASPFCTQPVTVIDRLLELDALLP
jgi:hypothetical protein